LARRAFSVSKMEIVVEFCWDSWCLGHPLGSKMWGDRLVISILSKRFFSGA
jgi:hypothetical protein